MVSSARHATHSPHMSAGVRQQGLAIATGAGLTSVVSPHPAAAQSIDGSRQRLQVDSLDLVQVSLGRNEQ